MTKATLLIIFFFGVTGLTSQNVWIDQNAKWYYDWVDRSGPAQGYIEYNYVKDTLISGKNCEFIKGTQRRYEMTSSTSGWVYRSSVSLDNQFTYSQGDSIFHFANGNFYVLLDFSANVGDTWIINIEPDVLNCTFDTTRVVVDSIGTVNLNSQNYRWISIHTIGSVAGSVDSAMYFYEGKFVERFGLYEYSRETVNHLFPVRTIRSSSIQNPCSPSLIVEYFVNTYYCFSDNSFNHTVGNGSLTCSQPNWTTIHETFFENSVKIFPNPTHSSQVINIEIQDGFGSLESITLRNIEGKIVFESTNHELLTPKETGVYFLTVLTSEGSVTKKIVVN